LDPSASHEIRESYDVASMNARFPDNVKIFRIIVSDLFKRWVGPGYPNWWHDFGKLRGFDAVLDLGSLPLHCISFCILSSV